MRNTELMVGAFYNPHLGRELAVATGIDHLAMADPPAASDPSWPAISERYTLLLHDYLGQLSEPLDERSIQRARALAELYRSPWVAEHFQDRKSTRLNSSHLVISYAVFCLKKKKKIKTLRKDALPEPGSPCH